MRDSPGLAESDSHPYESDPEAEGAQLTMVTDVKARVRKMNGLGNEIVVLDARALELKLVADQVKAIAADSRTIFDQLMVLRPPELPETLARIEIFNRDGSVAGACGNGMRCVALSEYLDNGTASQLYQTSAGLLSARVDSPDAITFNMGEPKFEWGQIPLREAFADTTRIELQAGPIDRPILHSPSVCNVGNPHAVFWVDDVDSCELDRVGPLLEHHPIFPEQANISIAQILSNAHVKVRTWERGAGLTRACGSAACAVAVCGARLGKLGRQSTISLPGGDLSIEWTAKNMILMTGPAVLESEGQILFGADGAPRYAAMENL